MRLGAWFFAVAILGGPCWAAGPVMPPKVVVTPLPAEAKPQPVSLTRAVVRIDEGRVWAKESDFLTCGMLTRKSQWRADISELETERLQSVFDEELGRAGFKRQNINLFEDPGEHVTALQVGALITDMEALFCGNYDATPVTYSGRMRMTVEWQVYDALKREVLARIETTAGGEERTRSVDGAGRVFLAGFRENVRALAANEQFRALVVAPEAGAPTSQASSASLSQIRLSGLANRRVSIAEASGAVVALFTASGFGSGVLVSSDGYLLTNEHVVGAAKTVRVRWSDGFESVGQVVRSNKPRDVALIRTEPHGRAPFALNRAAPAVGTPVFAIGTPLDPKLQNTVTRGVVSANRIRDGFSFIQSDVSVTHGNSGGPLLNEDGAVIGLTVLGLYPNESKSLNLFIPIGDALDFLKLTVTD